MKISRKWLQEYFDAELPGAEALALALTFHAFEIESVEPYAPADTAAYRSEQQRRADDILDVKITANRGHDCLSHRGIAKELSAILGVRLARDPLADAPDLSKTIEAVSVSIENSRLCRRYIAGYIRGVRVGPSPAWLQERLGAIGQRSINNVVDATNFVMFNLGQPLHAFDAGKLAAPIGPSSVSNTQDGPLYKIVVRNAKTGEKMAALDGKEYALNESMLVIADANTDSPIGIAGVKGGMPAAITEKTADLIIESANFDGPSIRKTAAALRLRTDASARFEQVISPELAAYGMRSVVELVGKLAGGELVGYADTYPDPQLPVRASVSTTQVRNILGGAFGEKEIENSFTRLGLPFSTSGGRYTVEVPFERLDLQISEDLIEEVGRIQGYDKIPARALPNWDAAPAVNARFYAAEAKRQELLSQGYSEIFTSVFADEGERVVLNKADGVRPYLRSSLLPGLREALKKNLPNKDLLGLKEIKLFEIGTVFKDGGEEAMVGTITETQEAAEAPLEQKAAASYDTLPFSAAVRYEPFSRFPCIVRDVAAWVPQSASEEGVHALIRQQAGELAARVSLFDRFEKDGRVSLAFRLVFQSFTRTLEDKEANEAMERVHAALRAQGFEIR